MKQAHGPPLWCSGKRTLRSSNQTNNNDEEDRMKSIRDTRGFTLIELLVVVAIIGILAAIAIPQFAIYRQKGFDSQALSDLRNAATAEEAYFATNHAYIDCTGGAACQTALPGYVNSSGVDIAMALVGTDAFTGTATHSQGTGKTFNYNSAAGGMQ
jgi:type IV pilus assembly protein PilA